MVGGFGRAGRQLGRGCIFVDQVQTQPQFAEIIRSEDGDYQKEGVDSEAGGAIWGHLPVNSKQWAVNDPPADGREQWAICRLVQSLEIEPISPHEDGLLPAQVGVEVVAFY